MTELAIQDPSEVLTYCLDWSSTLGADSIAESAWTIAPAAGVVLSAPANTTTTASVDVAGVTIGQVYELMNQVTTAAGDVREDGYTIRCFPK